MSAHLTEEEQLEMLKRWWKDHGQSLVIGVILALGAYLAWQWWQGSQRAQAEAASSQYQQLVEAMAVEPGVAPTDEMRATAKHLAGQLKTDHTDSLYAKSAALFIAKLAVESDDLVAAASELQWVLAQKPAAALERLARLRLARVQTAQGEHDQALQTLNAAVATEGNADTYAAAYAQVQGDIYLAQGKPEQARTAYASAMDKIAAEEGAQREILQMKIDDLQSKVSTADVQGDAQ